MEPVRGHDAPTRLISVVGAVGALLVLFLHAWLGVNYHTVDPAGDLYSMQLSTIAGLTVASFLTTAPDQRKWVYRAAFPSVLCGVIFPWLHALAAYGTTTYRLLNALSPVGNAMVAFGVTWALRMTAAEDASQIEKASRPARPEAQRTRPPT